MACCAASIFILCQIIFCARNAMAFLSGGRWCATERPMADDGVVGWRLAGSTLEPLEAIKPEHGLFPASPRCRSVVATGSLAVVGIAFFVLTKPGYPSAISETGVMAPLHAKLCGPGPSAENRAVAARNRVASLAHFDGRYDASEPYPH